MPDYFDEVISLYVQNVQSIEELSAGEQRAKRGKFVEFTCETLIKRAWSLAGGAADRLSFGTKKYKLEIKPSYLNKFSPELKTYIRSSNDKYYKVKVDRHVFIDGIFVMGIECKSYTENAMLKRIMVDFLFLKETQPNSILCVLLQLESMLGGDYEKAKESVNGSPSSHSIMSKFSNIDLHILTLLEGERHPKEPIFKQGFKKDLKKENVEYVVEKLKELLAQFVENG